MNDLFSNEVIYNDSDVWFTPPSVFKSLGKFDLDPCTGIVRPWDIALNNYTIKDNGLIKKWDGRIWMNPPYSHLLPWMQKMANHKNGIALTFIKSDTVSFHRYVFPVADSLFYFKGRLSFYNESGRKKDSSRVPSVLIAYTEMDSDIIAESGLIGYHNILNNFSVFVIRNMSKTWKIVVGEAMQELNEAKLEDIYDKIMSISPGKIKKNPNFKAKIRQTLQYYCVHVDVGIWKKSS